MRCKACNVPLSDFEGTRRYKHTNQYVDLCNQCFSSIQELVEVTERYDLLKEDDYDESQN